jgi:O-antigen ligase
MPEPAARPARRDDRARREHDARPSRDREGRRSGPALTLVALLAWTLFAFAGALPWTTIPLIAGALVLTALVRPSIGRGAFRVIDIGIVACLMVVAFQIVPIPAAARLLLSPEAGGVDSALWLGAPADPFRGPARALSLDAAATRTAILLALSFVALFWSARTIFMRGGVRLVARGIAWTGLALAVVAIMQHATAPRMLYWRWPTVFGGPFGPYVNKNDFSTWLIMAIPLTAGYAMARMHSRHRGNTAGLTVLHALTDGTAVWLTGAACFMCAALLTAASRSGITGGAAALLCFAWLSGKPGRRRGRARFAAGLAAVAVVLAAAAAYANLALLADRVRETAAGGVGGRRVIWADTWPMLRDFWLTGVGAGAYQRGMIVYQQHLRGQFYFNHAHNEYLQLAAEGGVLLVAGAGVALVAALRQIARRVRRDDTPIFWVRAGAASGLVAVAVQSFWDTGLRMPANAALFAVLAALALHDSGEPRRTREKAQRHAIDVEPSGRRL